MVWTLCLISVPKAPALGLPMGLGGALQTHFALLVWCPMYNIDRCAGGAHLLRGCQLWEDPHLPARWASVQWQRGGEVVPPCVCPWPSACCPGLGDRT